MHIFAAGIVASALLLGVPAMAQDVLGPVDPTDYTGAITLGSAIDAQAKRQGGENFRGTGFSETYVREQCAGLPRDRARLGATHRRVVRWTGICHTARLSRQDARDTGP